MLSNLRKSILTRPEVLRRISCLYFQITAVRKNALDLEAAKAYASLKSNKCITTTPPESAKLYNHFVNSSGTSIPHSGITLLDVEEQYILYWITQGAKDN
jgi:hypothetical protein